MKNTAESMDVTEKTCVLESCGREGKTDTEKSHVNGRRYEYI